MRASTGPRLYLIDDGHPRALSVGRGAGSSGIALTQGLVTLLTPAELEGVLAHELAHARNRDALVQTPVVLLADGLVEASRIGGFLERALLFVLGPVAASIVQVFLSPKRELAADLRAAGICGSPHPLADALVRIEQAEELVRFQGEPRHRAALHRQPVRAPRARRDVLDAPAGRGAGRHGSERSTRSGATGCRRRSGRLQWRLQPWFARIVCRPDTGLPSAGTGTEA